MRVLITGASGKLGAYIIRELMADHELVLFSRSQPADEFSRFPWVQGDLNSFADCQRALVGGIEAVQHIGAQPWPTDHPNMRAQANTQGIPFDATFKRQHARRLQLDAGGHGSRSQNRSHGGQQLRIGPCFRISGTPFPIASLPLTKNTPATPKTRTASPNARAKTCWSAIPAPTVSAPT